ncbi:hypothetical protein SprV_0602093900 [Sparganum proliferum]
MHWLLTTIDHDCGYDSPGEANIFMLSRISNLLRKMSASPKDDRIQIGLLPVRYRKLSGVITDGCWARFEIILTNATITMQSRTFTEPFALMEKVETSARVRAYRCGSSTDFGFDSLKFNGESSALPKPSRNKCVGGIGAAVADIMPQAPRFWTSMVCTRPPENFATDQLHGWLGAVVCILQRLQLLQPEEIRLSHEIANALSTLKC